MHLKNYPYKLHIKKAMKNFMTTGDVFDYLKERGILVSAYTKDDYAKIGMDFYFSRYNYLELKKRIDGDQNYRKSSRYTIPTNQINNLKSALLSFTNTPLDEEDTRVRVIGQKDGNWSFEVKYIEYKPGMINFLDTTERNIEVNINQNGTMTNLDFNLEGPNDHKKVTKILNLIHEENPELKFTFDEIELKKLPKNYRVMLFDNFFKVENNEWELKKILKLKVNRDDTQNPNTDSVVSNDQLKGINSALLDGENLIENEFVKTIINEEFYFTMATMRFDHRSSPKFIDFSIDFKTRPDRFESKITSSGVYLSDEKGLKENKKVMDSNEQDKIIFQFKNDINDIYNKLLSEYNPLTNIPEVELIKEITDVAATQEKF